MSKFRSTGFEANALSEWDSMQGIPPSRSRPSSGRREVGRRSHEQLHYQKQVQHITQHITLPNKIRRFTAGKIIIYNPIIYSVSYLLTVTNWWRISSIHSNSNKVWIIILILQLMGFINQLLTGGGPALCQNCTKNTRKKDAGTVTPTNLEEEDWCWPVSFYICYHVVGTIKYITYYFCLQILRFCQFPMF